MGSATKLMIAKELYDADLRIRRAVIDCMKAGEDDPRRIGEAVALTTRRVRRVMQSLGNAEPPANESNINRDVPG